MTTDGYPPDTTTLATLLRQIARNVRGEAQLNEPGWPLRLERLGEQLAVIAEQLRGRTLITLPAPDAASNFRNHNGPLQDRWYCEQGTLEAEPAEHPGEAKVWFNDDDISPDDARELGLALIAAAERATAGQPATEEATA